MRVFTQVDAVLGPKRSFTPEGYLYCEDVPLARTGTQIYMPDEIGIAGGSDGLVHVERRPEDVFNAKAVASFQGKPVTDDHPALNLTSKQWRDHARGTILNPRQGEGDQTDLMVGDLLIYDADIIQKVADGKREVSCGYTAEYEITGPGRARQLDIIGNHVALVKQGRCGGRCAIGDHAVTDQVTPMAAKTKAGKITLKDALAQVLATHDEGVPASTSGTEVHVHLHGRKGAADADETPPAPKPPAPAPAALDAVSAALKPITDSLAAINARLDKIEGGKPAADAEKSEAEQKAEKEKLDEEAAKKEAPKKDAKDSAVTLTKDAVPGAIADFKSQAELLVPGIKLPTLDSAADPKIIQDTLCAQRRSVLSTAIMLPASSAILLPLLANQPTVDRMTCDAVSMVFVAASEVARTKNNASSGGSGGTAGVPAGARKVGDQLFTGPISPREINARNRARYEGSK